MGNKKGVYCSTERYQKVMKPYFETDAGVIYQGHVLDVLRGLSDGSVQCVVTSPPYWGLRVYEGEPLVWGGDENCNHEWGDECGKVDGPRHGTGASTLHDKDSWGDRKSGNQGQFCLKCNAWKGSLGLEPSIDLYLDHLMQIMKGLWRVLRDDGVCFWNIGDCFAGSGSPGGDFRDGKGGDDYLRPYNRKGNNLCAKSLCLVPQKFAIRCQEAGWIIRSEIIWAKPNPMPESVIDRPTRSHEQIWMMVKQGKYFWDQEAIREKGATPVDSKAGHTFGGKKNNTEYLAKSNQPGKKWAWTSTRNIRDVWAIATEPFAEAHFAAFPTKLAETCIRAGTSKRGCCVVCGAPWGRISKRKPDNTDYPSGPGGKKRYFDVVLGKGDKSTLSTVARYKSKTIGWQPTCKCKTTETVPCIVLDPFFGAGTVGVVCKNLDRKFIGIELSKEYCEMVAKRIDSTKFGIEQVGKGKKKEGLLF